MKIVIAPDSFKGSISARDLCASVRQGILAVYPAAEVVELPLADGGEGTLENMVYSTRGVSIVCDVTDPIGRPIKAAYGVLGDGRTAVIEMAQASGLSLLAEAEHNPLAATSRGTGELIRHALDAGYRRFIVGLGGSATNDGGSGMLKALGAGFYDHSDVMLGDGGAALRQLASIDISGMDPRLKESSFTIAGDVTNPLCGDNGASVVFGPQKGATPQMVGRLDQALNRFAAVVRDAADMDVRDMPGSGAAGGMGAALLAFMKAEFKPGIEIVMAAIDFQTRIQGAHLIITGEGRLDIQTLSGKVIAGVCRKAASARIPVIALCGRMELSGEQMDGIGLRAGFSIVPKPCSLEQAMTHAPVWAQERTEQLMRLLRLNP